MCNLVAKKDAKRCKKQNQKEVPKLVNSCHLSTAQFLHVWITEGGPHVGTVQGPGLGGTTLSMLSIDQPWNVWDDETCGRRLKGT